MIFIYQDYDYTDMPLGGWDTNCFDGRLCEEDYSEKIIDFINFMAHSDQPDYAIPKPVPQWTFSSNHDGIDYWRIFWGGEESAEYILALQEWGKLFDSFLCSRNDYLLFDYLVNTIHKDNEYNENHLIKAFSLCQLFLERHKESELDAKLPQFFELLGPESDTKRQAELFRKMRNKIAHGDFLAFETVIETNPLRITSMMSCRVTSEILSIYNYSTFINGQSVAPYTASVGIISFLYCAGDFPISFLNTLLKYSGFSYPTISEISLML